MYLMEAFNYMNIDSCLKLNIILGHLFDLHNQNNMDITVQRGIDAHSKQQSIRSSPVQKN